VGIEEFVVLSLLDSLLDKDERKLVQGDKVSFTELGHLRGDAVHPGLHPGKFSAVPSGLDHVA
jgi:hypothetical protein